MTLSNCRSSAVTPARGLGDPQLHGFLGQNVQVHGMDGEVYSILSSPQLQLNARFAYLGAGKCPQTLTSRHILCWSAPRLVLR